MAKHRSAWNSKRYHRLIREGRGQGTLKDYLPWITIHDLASKGVSSRVLGRKTGRIHHLLSRNETAFFYILDASDKVLDIREQFPLLTVDETVRIAEEAGIRHTRDNHSFYPYVMTTDFVITTLEGLKARSVKLSSELSNPRVLEKLEIERRYWKNRGVDWRIVTEKQIDFQKARNLEWIGRSQDYPSQLPEGVRVEETMSYFLELYTSTTLPVTDISRIMEETFGLAPGLGLTAYQYLLLHKRIEADLSRPMDLTSVRAGIGEGWCSWAVTYA